MDVLINQKLEALRLAKDAELDVLCQNTDTGQFERIWNSGRTLTVEQALGFALGENTG